MITATRAGVETREYITLPTVRTYQRGVDLIAVERVVNGGTASLTARERVYAARLLAGRGWDFSWIGKRLGVPYATVVAWQDNGWKAVKGA